MQLNEIFQKKRKEKRPTDVEYSPGETVRVSVAQKASSENKELPTLSDITSADVTPKDRLEVIEDRGDTVVLDLSQFGTKYRKVEFPKEYITKE